MPDTDGNVVYGRAHQDEPAEDATGNALEAQPRKPRQASASRWRHSCQLAATGIICLAVGLIAGTRLRSWNRQAAPEKRADVWHGATRQTEKRKNAPEKQASIWHGGTTRQKVDGPAGGAQLAKSSTTTSRPGPTTSPVQPTPAIAVVISGQVARFVYKDSMALVQKGLTDALGCAPSRGRHLQCRGIADFYVVLADTRAEAWSGIYGPPSYHGDVVHAPQKVREYFEARGASSVHLRVYSSKESNALHSRIDKKIAETGGRAIGASPEAFRATWSRYGRRWRSNKGMYLFRHLAFSAALEAERSLPYRYTRFLVMREDNVFLGDPNISNLLCELDGCRKRGKKEPHQAGPVPSVLVDAKCGWGSFSDKLYLADRATANVLFSQSEDDHIRRMATLLLGGSFVKRRAGHTSPEEQLQPEYFYQFLMETAGVQVRKVDFNRTDLRYVDGKPCIPPLYHGCTVPQKVYKACHR